MYRLSLTAKKKPTRKTIVAIVTALIEATKRIPTRLKGVTYFSATDVWRFILQRTEGTCIACDELEGSIWTGDQLRTPFPYLMVLAANTIGGPVNGDGLVHPNCRCRLKRLETFYPELTIHYPGEFDEDSTMVKAVQKAFDDLPEEAKRLVDDVFIYPKVAAPKSSKTGGTVAGTWNRRQKTVKLWGDHPTAYTDEVVEHEAAHAVYDDITERENDVFDKWEKRIQRKTDDMKEKGAPDFKYEDPDWKGDSINTVTTRMHLQRRKEYEAIGRRAFQQAILDEGSPSDYADAWKDHKFYNTECFAETTASLMSDSPWLFNRMMNRPKTVAAWKKMVKPYKLRMET